MKVYSIKDFCKAFSISRSYFYKLKDQDKAPKTFNLGKKVMITSEAAHEWQKSMEAQ